MEDKTMIREIWRIRKRFMQEKGRTPTKILLTEEEVDAWNDDICKHPSVSHPSRYVKFNTTHVFGMQVLRRGNGKVRADY